MCFRAVTVYKYRLDQCFGWTNAICLNQKGHICVANTGPSKLQLTYFFYHIPCDNDWLSRPCWMLRNPDVAPDWFLHWLTICSDECWMKTCKCVVSCPCTHFALVSMATWVVVLLICLWGRLDIIGYFRSGCLVFPDSLVHCVCVWQGLLYFNIWPRLVSHLNSLDFVLIWKTHTCMHTLSRWCTQVLVCNKQHQM